MNQKITNPYSLLIIHYASINQFGKKQLKYVK